MLGTLGVTSQEKLAQLYIQNPERYFTEIKILIYVFDVNYVENAELSMFAQTVEQLEKFSPDAKLFVLLHKMDTISQSKRMEVFEEKKRLISNHVGKCIEVSDYFATSIWDVTLYNVSITITSGLE